MPRYCIIGTSFDAILLVLVLFFYLIIKRGVSNEARETNFTEASASQYPVRGLLVFGSSTILIIANQATRIDKFANGKEWPGTDAMPGSRFKPSTNARVRVYEFPSDIKEQPDIKVTVDNKMNATMPIKKKKSLLPGKKTELIGLNLIKTGTWQEVVNFLKKMGALFSDVRDIRDALKFD